MAFVGRERRNTKSAPPRNYWMSRSNIRQGGGLGDVRKPASAFARPGRPIQETLVLDDPGGRIGLRKFPHFPSACPPTTRHFERLLSYQPTGNPLDPYPMSIDLRPSVDNLPAVCPPGQHFDLPYQSPL